MWDKIVALNLQDWAHLATIVGVVSAVTVYILNSIRQQRQRSVDNAMRYWDCHRRLFSLDGYCHANVKAMEDGTYKRDLNDLEMERKFNDFLCTCENIALLLNAGGAPKSINAYMIGWFAKRIYPVLADREKAEPYWELAVDFLWETTLQAEKLDKMTRKERLRYLKKNHFS